MPRTFTIIKQQILNIEQRQLIAVIERLITPSPTPTQPLLRDTADARAEAVYSLRQKPQLTGAEAAEILAACVDTRSISKDKVASVSNKYSVAQVAWELLEQQWSLQSDAMTVLLRQLGHQDALICAAAARVIKTHNRQFTANPDIRRVATQKIMGLLKDDVLSRRPLNTPDYIVWRLDDVLFETLQALGER